MVRSLGRGTFAEVFLVRREGRHEAAKLIQWAGINRAAKENIRREVSILAGVSHPNIVRLFHADTDSESGFVVIFLEYCHGGDLHSFIRSEHTNGMPESDAKRFLRQLAAGLRALWDAGIAHRDLKPQVRVLRTQGRGSRTPKQEAQEERDVEPNGHTHTKHTLKAQARLNGDVRVARERDGARARPGEELTGSVKGARGGAIVGTPRRCAALL